MTRTKRLDPSVFHLPVERMREGYYSDKYFVRAREILLADGHRPRVTMQVFAKTHAFLGGMDESVAILKLCAVEWKDLVVHALFDGDEVEPWETVMLIEGPYDAFAHLETLYLGVIARRTKVGTNTRPGGRGGPPQGSDVLPGAARPLAGADGGRLGRPRRRSDRRLHRRAGLLVGEQGGRHRAHALIAAYGGDTVRATRKFADHMAESVRLITLVDFENDSVGTSLACARALGGRLYGVRLDTSETMVDKSVIPQMGSAKPTGVTPQLVHNVRTALDREGFSGVKIVVSGGIDVRRSAASKRRRCRWTPTAWARPSSPGATISPPTSCWWRGSRAPRRGGATGPIPGWSG